MAFTDTQKVAIRRYLCIPLGRYQYNTVFESMLDKVGAVAEEKTAVESILTELATVAGKIATMGSASAATGLLKKVDEVEFYDRTGANAGAFVTPVTYGRVLCRRLADCFGVEPNGDYFSARRNVSAELPLG